MRSEVLLRKKPKECEWIYFHNLLFLTHTLPPAKCAWMPVDQIMFPHALRLPLAVLAYGESCNSGASCVERYNNEYDEILPETCHSAGSGLVKDLKMLTLI
jgi:hypothetical protein